MIALLMLLQATTPPQAMPAFLAGCWEQRQADGRWTEECWTSARGGLMIGSGRDGKGDEVRHWEWMRIERGADGSLTFYGSPKGAAAVGFQVIEADATSITFVNASHDYPQRIRYAVSRTGLDAEVSLADGSNPNRWRYKRVAGDAK